MSKNSKTPNIWSLFGSIPRLISGEFTTKFGRMNLVCDLVLAAVVVAIFTVSTFERIAIVIASIWNKEITEHLSNAETLTAFILLVGFFIVCLIFVYISEKIISSKK